MGNCKRRQFNSKNSTDILRARPLIETNFKMKGDTKEILLVKFKIYLFLVLI